MIVDLNPLPYRQALELLKWCLEHNVDIERARTLTEALTIVPDKWGRDVIWELDIPEKYITFFLLKWSSPRSELQTQ